jgi:hypothetical protein
MGWASQRNEEQFYWEHHSGKKAIRISFDKRPHRFFFSTIPLGYECAMSSFDKVLTNKETVDYVDHLAAANFDPEFFTSWKKKFKNNLLTNCWYKKQYNMSKSLTIFPSPS